MRIALVVIIMLLFIFNLSAEESWIGRDKVAHFTTSAFLTYWTFGVSDKILEQSKRNSLIFSISFTSLMGIAKECSDKHIIKTSWSWRDITYDVIGIFAGIVLINNMK
jgi:uncharacterized protein YfiM (DUF2279 family)